METAKRINQLYICSHCGSPVKVLSADEHSNFILNENCPVCGHYGAIPLMHKSDIDMDKLLDMLIVPKEEK